MPCSCRVHFCCCSFFWFAFARLPWLSWLSRTGAVSYMMTSPTIEDEWLWGWDPMPGIVSIWADASGRALVWRRIPSSGDLVRETERFRPWMLLDSLADLQHVGS